MEFVRGYSDATDEDDIYSYVELDDVTFKIIYSEIYFQNDMPDLSKCKNIDDVISEMEMKGWRIDN